MYLYFGLLTHQPYAILEPFYLIFESELKFGTSVRAFWTWTKNPEYISGTDTKTCLFTGTIDKVQASDATTPGTTFGMFYDLPFPFDVFIGQDQSTALLTVFRTGNPGPDTQAVSCIKLWRMLRGRTAADNYQPVLPLSAPRFYALGHWNDAIFAIIVPGNLYAGAPIWVIFQSDTALFIKELPMDVVAHDDASYVQVKFTVTDIQTSTTYSAKIQLQRDSTSWTCKDWEVQTLSSQSTKQIVRRFIVGDGRILGPFPRLNHPQFHGGHFDEIVNADDGASASSRTDSSAWPCMVSSSDLYVEKSKTAPTLGLTKVENDTSNPIFCKLVPSGVYSKAKVQAGIGLGLPILGVLPFGGFVTPISVYGMLLAGAGLNDHLNDSHANTEKLLWLNGSLQRQISATGPVNNDNDLIVMRADISTDKKGLLLRVGLKEKVGNGSTYLSYLENLYNTVLSIPGDYSKKTIQSAVFVKIAHLKPSASTTSLGQSESTYSISDGEMVFNKSGDQSLFKGLSSTNFITSTTLFSFDSSDSIDMTLMHTNKGTSSRIHDVVTVPATSIVLLKLSKCKIDLSNSYAYYLSSSISSEGDALAQIKKDAGFMAYYRDSASKFYGYTLGDLASQTGVVKVTNDESDMVYVATSAWLPWQGIVSSG